MKKLFLIFIILLWFSDVWADTYTVCPSGCTGTSLQTVYNAASCGDTVEVHIDGDFTEVLGLNKSCSSGTVITIKNGAGHSPTNNVPSQGDYVNALVISGTYHVWDGINVTSARGDAILLTGGHCTIQNSTISNGSYYIPLGDGEGVLIRSSNNVIQNCTFGDNIHGAIYVDGIGYTSRYNQILNNTVNNRYGHGLQALGSGASYNLFDGNYVTDCGSLCVGFGCMSKNGVQLSGASNNSFRRNTFFGIYNRAVEISSYSGNNQNTNNNWFYNNTFYNITTRANDTDTVAWVIAGVGISTNTVSGNKFYNNIVDKVAQKINTGLWNNNIALALYYAGETDLGDNLTELTSGDWGGNYLVSNIIRPYYSSSYQASSSTAVYYTNAGGSYHTGWSVSSVNGVGSMSGNITSDPLFTSTDTSTTHWWYPQSGSPAIDGGVVVTDPNASTGGWEQLTYNGSAPDIGAYEATGGTTTTTLTGGTIQGGNLQ